EAVAKLVRIARDCLIAGTVLRHVHQTLVRDAKHFLTLRRCKQLCFASGKGTTAVERVADTKLQNFRNTQLFINEHRPNFATFLVRDGRKHIDGERRTHDCGLELRTEICLKPCKRVPGFHGTKLDSNSVKAE